MTKVAILGAGINGLSSGVKIKEKYNNLDVTIVSKEFSPDTTGDGSGGLWLPYLCGDTATKLLGKWGGETYRFYHKLWLEGGFDINLLPIFQLYTDECDLSVNEWSTEVFGYNLLSEKQLDYFNELYSSQYQSGRTFTTFVVNPPTILEYMHKRFVEAGGKFQKVTVTSLEDAQLAEYDIIINCLGLGAREVVPDDKVYSIRGQICKVLSPWINQVIVDECTGHYIIPNVTFCVLGGTHQDNDYNTNTDPDNKDFIMNGCQTMLPGLKHVKVIKHWVGLRPARDEIRLEAENRNGKLYVHNYGHGGSGLTLFWGCSSEVLKLFENHTSRKVEYCKL